MTEENTTVGQYAVGREGGEVVVKAITTDDEGISHRDSDEAVVEVPNRGVLYIQTQTDLNLVNNVFSSSVEIDLEVAEQTVGILKDVENMLRQSTAYGKADKVAEYRSELENEINEP